MAAPESDPKPMGQMALHAALAMRRPLPATQSYVVAGARRTVERPTHTVEYYPPTYGTGGSLVENLRFALRHEPLDLGIVHEALGAIGPKGLADWVRQEPTGEFSRRAWFFFEHLRGEQLDLDPVATGNYVNAFNDELHVVAAPRNSRRHRVRDNLLGNARLCPTVRRTPALTALMAQQMSLEAHTLAAHYDPETLARAVSYLFTKETRSSFALEGEAPSSGREARFGATLQRLHEFEAQDKRALVQLQNSIVEPRYASADWRAIQNYVSGATRGFGQHVHYVCPRPEAVGPLMSGWAEMHQRLLDSGGLDPVVAAAVSSFAFVFIHPFEDGNGRIHRFLMHQVLAHKEFTPAGLVFPISAAILRQRHLYDNVLDRFSKPMLPYIDWSMAPDGALTVTNETRDLYRFFDATPQAEYLYERVAETIRFDLKEELGFLTAYDAAYRAVTRIVDVPDRRAALLAKLLLQNGGRLSKSRRGGFSELEDGEIEAMERGVQAVIAEYGEFEGPAEVG